MSAPTILDLSNAAGSGVLKTAPRALAEALLARSRIRLMPGEFVETATRPLIEELDMHAGASPAVFAFTSARRGEGVSTVCCSVALALGLRSSRRVLMVDGNFQNPAITAEPGAPGFADLLLARADASGAVSPVAGNLSVLSAGRTEFDLSGETTDSRIAQVLSQLRERFGTVLIDLAPPVGSPFGVRIARASAGVVLVVEAHRTAREDVQVAVDRLRRADATILGVVYNRRRHEF